MRRLCLLRQQDGGGFRPETRGVFEGARVQHAYTLCPFSSEGSIRMRNIIAATLACLLTACSGLPPTPGPTCSTAYECEIQGYANAGN